MKIAKEQIIALLVEADELPRAERADELLSEEVDVEADADKLAELGLDPGLLATQMTNLEP